LTHDELTGLYNKEGFYETVKETLKKEPRSDYMLICTNVRDFKIINDLFGFDKGNEIIQKIAAMINTGTYQKDVTARIVADQFAILTTKDRYDAVDMSKQLAEVSKLIASSYYSMTIHCGIYNITNPEMEVSLMCDRANMAISTIRDEPGNTIVTYDDKMMSDILHDRQVANQLEQAIDKNQFVIFLQPQVTPLGEVIGAEALVRWDDPKRGILTPGVFIDILEKTGCLYKLDLHVWELAARQLAAWKGTPFERLNISVNISPKDFYYVDVFKEFTGLVNKYDISPSKLKLEITETALMIEPTRQLTLIGKLNNFGFDFEIDDFGTGYSSLSLLKDMPAEILKIDMEFLHETENEQRSKKILESIISLAHELKMKVITEGVEYEHQVKSLRELGCDIFQGYYYSKPLPVSEFEEKYRDHVNK
jgi:diguanylate cyclase (GGDEF)-like protein